MDEIYEKLKNQSGTIKNSELLNYLFELQLKQIIEKKCTNSSVGAISNLIELLKIREENSK